MQNNECKSTLYKTLCYRSCNECDNFYTNTGNSINLLTGLKTASNSFHPTAMKVCKKLPRLKGQIIEWLRPITFEKVKLSVDLNLPVVYCKSRGGFSASGFWPSLRPCHSYDCQLPQNPSEVRCSYNSVCKAAFKNCLNKGAKRRPRYNKRGCSKITFETASLLEIPPKLILSNFYSVIM